MEKVSFVFKIKYIDLSFLVIDIIFIFLLYIRFKGNFIMCGFVLINYLKVKGYIFSNNRKE